MPLSGVGWVPKASIEKMKQSLLNKIADLGKELPLNTLDELIDQFGGPEMVSEVRTPLLPGWTGAT